MSVTTLSEYQRLQEQARTIYASPDCAWGGPRFPAPPQEFLEPKAFVDQLADAVFDCNEQFHHPFVVRLMRGEVTAEELRGMVKADYPFLVEVVRSDAHIVSTAADLQQMRKQMLVLIEEAGDDLVGGGHPAHPTLWVEFGVKGLGMTEEEIVRAPLHPLMELYLDSLRLRRLQTRIGEMPSNSRFSERTRSVVYPLWKNALKEHYGIPEKALTFFAVHGEEDWGHGNIGKDVLAPLAANPDAQRRFWTTEGRRLERAWMRLNIWQDYVAFERARSAS